MRPIHRGSAHPGLPVEVLLDQAAIGAGGAARQEPFHGGPQGLRDGVGDLVGGGGCRHCSAFRITELFGLDAEVEADRGQFPAQDPLVLLLIDQGDAGVQFLQRGDVGDRDQVGPAEAAALLFDSALLVGAFLTRDAVEGIESEQQVELVLDCLVRGCVAQALVGIDRPSLRQVAAPSPDRAGVVQKSDAHPSTYS